MSFIRCVRVLFAIAKFVVLSIITGTYTQVLKPSQLEARRQLEPVNVTSNYKFHTAKISELFEAEV